MSRFSKEIEDFLSQVGADQRDDVAIVPKSDSCANPGDVVFFRYMLGIGKGSREYRIFLITEPVTKDAATGNILLTGFKVPTDRTYTPNSLETLYKNRELPKDNYRTYILGHIYGPLRRIRKI
jgi:hypothetical protein